MKARRRGHVLQAVGFGLVTGILAGGGAFVFLEGLDLVTDTRLDQPRLLWLLPVFGLLWGLVQWWSGAREPWRRALRGTTLVVEQARRPDRGIPRRQAPLVLVGTWAAHLTGASVGREGVGLQLSASMAEHVARWWRLERQERRILLVGAIAGGFGAVFDVPWAGALFALEVAGRPRWRVTRGLTAVVASFTGDAVVGWLGHEHSTWPRVEPDLGLGAWLAVVVAAAGFAITARGFVAAVDSLRNLAVRSAVHPVLRPVLGGVATVGLVGLVGRDYLGLSLPLLEGALAGTDQSVTVPLLKGAFTAVALASGFPGGEVTPLFVIGASLGAAASGPLALDVTTAGALGMVGVFAAASGAPLASAVMAVELFGGGVAAPALVACVVAAAMNRRRRIYPTDRGDQSEARTRMGN